MISFKKIKTSIYPSIHPSDNSLVHLPIIQTSIFHNLRLSRIPPPLPLTFPFLNPLLHLIPPRLTSHIYRGNHPPPLQTNRKTSELSKTRMFAIRHSIMFVRGRRVSTGGESRVGEGTGLSGGDYTRYRWVWV